MAKHVVARPLRRHILLALATRNANSLNDNNVDDNDENANDNNNNNNNDNDNDDDDDDDDDDEAERDIYADDDAETTALFDADIEGRREAAVLEAVRFAQMAALRGGESLLGAALEHGSTLLAVVAALHSDTRLTDVVVVFLCAAVFLPSPIYL